jgi:hypothetical protein
MNRSPARSRTARTAAAPAPVAPPPASPPGEGSSLNPARVMHGKWAVTWATAVIELTALKWAEGHLETLWRLLAPEAMEGHAGEAHAVVGVAFPWLPALGHVPAGWIVAVTVAAVWVGIWWAGRRMDRPSGPGAPAPAGPLVNRRVVARPRHRVRVAARAGRFTRPTLAPLPGGSAVADAGARSPAQATAATTAAAAAVVV